ncbi:glycoside hydrolase family 88 protein [Alkalihalobacillus hemicellulosilyticus]|uniref:Unsaturated glucuronyl hydrolase n=1 Tax=Halalkalibacter hemicellulosilyticusJCM 9152 TaxID=1236971 RepID=W4QIU4_9BACI|nr:glycoside hydrolase family 88 protein [Halalkalibacter hemicellulosilyticus]GAE31558.1 unsaturated glucuronyl hydrolase [Halalkalibacter hemicellulosilyticusJCM 9152]
MAEQQWLEKAWSHITVKLERTAKKIGARFPHVSVGGTYECADPHWWTAGFWPGQLWLVYRETKDESFKAIAEKCERQLDEVITGFDRLDHDMGFMWTLTSVARYKLLGEKDSRRRALLVANLLMGRFNANGNYIRAWNPWFEGDENTGFAIIDCMMNLPLLFWASKETGDPRYRAIATRHANTVLEHFIEEDGSVHHIVNFDPETGERVEFVGGQGYAPHSAWSRGTAWAVYGFALAYAHTNDHKYLQAAKKVAHFFIAHLPDDHVPHWDFRLPDDVPHYRDSSAGAIAACGLLLLADQVESQEVTPYKRAGERILHSLYERYGDWENESEDGLLLHGTGHYPEQSNVDKPLIYGDYYFVEGIARLRGIRSYFGYLKKC